MIDKNDYFNILKYNMIFENLKVLHLYIKICINNAVFCYLNNIPIFNIKIVGPKLE